MSLWWRPAAGSKIKDRRWRSFILFYFVNTTGFVILPRIPQGRERVRGGTFAGFPQDAAHRAQWRVTSVLPQAKSWHRRNSLPPSTFNPLGVERRAAAEPKNKRPPLAVFYFWCERWDLNPHDLTDTSTSSLPVCRFQHARERNLRYYNKIPPFVKRQPEKLPESFAVRPVAQAYKNSFFQGKEKTLEALRLQGFSCWCARRDLNPHARNEH